MVYATRIHRKKYYELQTINSWETVKCTYYFYMEMSGGTKCERTATQRQLIDDTFQMLCAQHMDLVPTCEMERKKKYFVGSRFRYHSLNDRLLNLHRFVYLFFSFLFFSFFPLSHKITDWQFVNWRVSCAPLYIYIWFTCEWRWRLLQIIICNLWGGGNEPNTYR